MSTQKCELGGYPGLKAQCTTGQALGRQKSKSRAKPLRGKGSGPSAGDRSSLRKASQYQGRGWNGDGSKKKKKGGSVLTRQELKQRNSILSLTEDALRSERSVRNCKIQAEEKSTCERMIRPASTDGKKQGVKSKALWFLRCFPTQQQRQRMLKHPRQPWHPACQPIPRAHSSGKRGSNRQTRGRCGPCGDSP